jgi:hypothetical protein
MQQKLTLRLDDELIRFGKEWARQRGTSVSRLVADYLALLDSLERDDGGRHPVTRRLLGCLSSRHEERS